MTAPLLAIYYVRKSEMKRRNCSVSENRLQNAELM